MTNESDFEVDILVIGGGTAGCVAAIKAKEALPDAEILILEKANVKRSGAIALGMDGVNNAVVNEANCRRRLSRYQG
jgi:succinate dehydrogenase/fumarate reductase flavoprotein subunit